MKRGRAGWYPDPSTVGAVRYWNGDEWTSFVCFGERSYRDPTPLVTVRAAADAADAETVRMYLTDALERGVVTQSQADSIRRDLDQLLRAPVAATPSPSPVAPSAAPVPAPAAASVRPTADVAPRTQTASARTSTSLPPPAARPVSPSPSPRAKVPAPVRVEPSALQQWWRRTRHTVSSDLAVHGLAYLGVAFLFAGVVGLVVVSASDVQPIWRGVTELLAPTSFFLAAWYLRRRNATSVARALSLLGGVTLPLVAVASVTDGSVFPPDVTGVALPIVQALLCAAVAAGMAVVVRRHADSVQRHLCLPVVWFGVGVLAAVLRDPIPTGVDAADPAAVQFTAILVAIAVTAVVLRAGRLQGPVARAALPVVVPVAGLVFVLEAIAAGRQGWPAVSGVVAAAAMVVVLEAAAAPLPRLVVTLGQAAAVLSGALRVLPGVDTAWAGMGLLVAMLGLLEWSERRRPALIGAIAASVGAALGLVVAAPNPRAGLAAFGVAMGWLLVRRVRPPAWLRITDTYGAAPAVGALMLGIEYWRLVDPSVAVMSFAGVALVAAAVRPRVPPMRDDILWRWFPPVVAVASSVAVLAIPWSAERWWVAAALVACSATSAISDLPVAVRTWLTTVLGVWSLANVAAALSMSSTAQAIVVASMATAAVMAAALVDRPVVRHLGFIGHLAGVAVFAVPALQDWTLAVVVGLATAAWWVVAVVDELRGACHLVRLGERIETAISLPQRAFRYLPLGASTVGAIATAIVALAAADAVPYGSMWGAAPVSAAAVALGAAARWVPWRRLHRSVVATGAVSMSVIAVALTASFGANDGARIAPWPMVAALAAGVGVVVLMSPRPLVVGWIGWAETAPLAMLVAERSGFDSQRIEFVLAAWGAVLMLGACALDRVRSGAAAVFGPMRTPTLHAPVVLGSTGFLVGALVGALGESITFAGWVAIGASVVVTATALLRPLGALSFVAEFMATVGLLMVVPWQPLDHPWSIVPWAAALLALAWVLRADATTGVWSRWDLPAFVAGHLTAAVALVASLVAGSIDVTFVSVAALMLAVALVLANPWWAVAAVPLVLVGAADAGRGWLAIALLVHAVAFTAVGWRFEALARRLLFAAGALSLVLSGATAVSWLDWSPETTLVVVAPTAATVALLAAAGLRRRLLLTDFTVTWLITGTAASIGASSVVTNPEVARVPGGWVVALSMAVLATAAAVIVPLIGAVGRWLAMGFTSLSVAAAVWTIDVGPFALVVVASSVALAMALALLLVDALRPTWPWIAPVAVFVGLVQLAGVVGLFQLRSAEPGPVIMVLLALAGEVAVAAALVDEPYLFTASPMFGCAAWLVFAAHALRDDPNWFTVPIGLSLLVIVGLLRWIRRTRGGAVAGLDVATLEFVGMSFVVGASLAQIVSEHLWYVGPAVAGGALLAVWGAVTRVRRRLAFGVGAVTLALVLVVGVPLTATVPTWRGPALWMALAAVGAIAIVVASFIERALATVRRLREVIDEMTHDWEHTGDGSGERGQTPTRGGTLAH